MKFCKGSMSVSRQGERALRAPIALISAAAVVLPLALVAMGSACHPSVDPGFDVVAVPSAAYLASSLPDSGPTADGGAREAGSGVASSSVKCVPPPEDEFEGNDEIPACPNENDDGWELDVRATNRQRDDREKDVCCFHRTEERGLKMRGRD